jgi:hypothetical protein
LPPAHWRIWKIHPSVAPPPPPEPGKVWIHVTARAGLGLRDASRTVVNRKIQATNIWVKGNTFTNHTKRKKHANWEAKGTYKPEYGMEKPVGDSGAGLHKILWYRVIYDSAHKEKTACYSTYRNGTLPIVPRTRHDVSPHWSVVTEENNWHEQGSGWHWCLERTRVG